MSSSTGSQPASQPTGTATPDDRAQQFVPVEGGTETTSAEAMLVAAYLVMWALLLGFVLTSWRRQGRIESRLDALEKAVDRADPAG